MKIKSIKLLSGVLLAAVCSTTMTGCMDEIEVTQVATEEQIASSSSASEALANAMPAYFNQIRSSYIDNGWHGAFGFAALMYARDRMTGDLAVPSSGYDHFTSYAENTALGERYAYSSYFWQYYYAFLLTANNMISGVDAENAAEVQLGYLGAGHAFRAMCYLDLSRVFEFLPNDAFPTGVNADGNDVTHLTVPIIRDGMTEEEARVNPRVTREEMYNFILEDLNKAEEYIPNLETTNGHTLPDLACVYGLKARLYMWVEDYANAQRYARLAIDAASVSPMSQTACLNTVSGMNDITQWMWGSQQNSESSTVQTSICNWTSWISNQTTFGYTGLGTGLFNYIDVNMYERISDTDFRKLWWVAPDGTALDGKNEFMSADFAAAMPAYASLKFRPNAGDYESYTTGGASAFPVMRVEEMYFIEAEAAAHQDASQGVQLIESFMQTYRDPSYRCRLTAVDEVVEEIVFQKRVELWGEGQTFYDIKRLNYSVTRGYQGTLFSDNATFNTNGRPAWMNLCISIGEIQNNPALEGWNNPDPSGCYTPWIGQ